MKLNLVLIFIAFAQFINCQNPCQNGGVQVLQPAASLSQACICQANYIGSTCNVRIDLLSASDKNKYGCEVRPCALGSTCEDRPDGSFICHCPTNYNGALCDQVTSNDPCSSKPCYNGGTCVKTSASTSTCICPSNFGGANCKTNKVGACAANPCQRDGLCVNNGNTDYKCQCPDWTLGKSCEVVFNPCSRVSCQNSGLCLKKRTLAYTCNCTSNYGGSVCESYVGNVVTLPTRPTVPTVPTYTTPTVTYNTQTTPSSSPQNTNSSCFPASSLVETMNRGSIKVSDLKKGDYVKSFDSNTNEWKFSKFLFYLHRDDDMLAEYISIKTSSNKNLLISSMHLIAKKSSSNIEFVLAKNLNLNDVLISEDNTNDKIVELTKVNEQGAYAPLLESGTISVNNILASCYANTKWHDLVHFVFQPIIKLSSYFNVEQTETINNADVKISNGVFWYAELLQTFLPFIPMSSSFVYL